MDKKQKKKRILSNMNYHPGLAEAKPVKLKQLTGGLCSSWLLTAASSASLQHGATQFKEKEALCTNLWVM